MTETLLRDRLELERQKLREADINRFGAIERKADVLTVLFDTLRDEFRKWREGAVSDEDLDKREEQIMAAVKEQLGHICDHIDNRNDQNNEKLINKVEAMFSRYETKNVEDRLAQSNALLRANDETRKEIIRYGIGFALSVITALVIFWLTNRLG